MAYWIYNMGLSVPVSQQQLLSKRKVQGLEKPAKNPAMRDTDDEETLPEPLAAEQSNREAKHPTIVQSAYSQEHQNDRNPVYRAEQIMSKPVVTLSPTMPFRQAWSLFLEKRFRHFIVTDEVNNLLGIVSDRDMLTKVAAMKLSVKSQQNETVAQVMNTSVITASKDTSIQEICRVMFNQHIGAIPITSEDAQVQGIITRSDILRSMIKHGPLELWV